MGAGSDWGCPMRTSSARGNMVAWCVAGATGLAVVAIPGIATAAPPANDEITNAVPLRPFPTALRVDATGATHSATDPAACTRGASVWYRLDPARNRIVRISTVGSDYDTLLAVYSGSPGSLTELACSDDAVVLASAVQVRIAAGRTYYVSVSACCRGSARGGHAAINTFGFRPLAASTALSRVTTGRISGRAFVSGSQRCSHPSAFLVATTVSQRVGRLVARGTGAVIFPLCTANRRRAYVVPVDSETGVAFQGGKAVLTFHTENADGFDFVVTPEINRIVTLTMVKGRMPLGGVPAAGRSLRPTKG